ncbi:MAG TPA: arylsulfotransferase family protein [Pseudomonadales bacterium]
MGTFVRESVPVILFALALLFLGYVAGSLTTLSDTFPSQYVRHAYQAAEALRLKRAYLDDQYGSNLWEPERSSARGVTVHVPGRAQPGLTLFTSGHGPSALLIDLQGRIVHEWKRPFRDVWDESSPVRDPVPEKQIYFEKAHVFPNGDLLAVYVGIGDTPWGYGLVKLDRHSNVIWKNLARFHHDVDVTEDGRIFGLTHRFRDEPVDGFPNLRPPVLEDRLVELTPGGEVRREISLLEAVTRSRYARKLYRILPGSLWDPLHTNAVDVLDEARAAALARKVPQAAPGQVLLSFRELDGGTVALLDLEREDIVWALSGSWKSQHDPDILPNGNILLFDNLSNFSDGGESRVVEVDPSHGGVVWSYEGSPEKPLRSYWRSAQQPLANGNVLITESQGARLLEVDRRGEIVWEYVNPVRARQRPTQVAIVNWATRIDSAALDESFRRAIAQSSRATTP